MIGTGICAAQASVLHSTGGILTTTFPWKNHKLKQWALAIILEGVASCQLAGFFLHNSHYLRGLGCRQNSTIARVSEEKIKIE